MPRACNLATAASMSSTANATRRIPRCSAARSGRRPGPVGRWNHRNSSRPWPSKVSNIAMSTRTPEPHHTVHPIALDRPLTLQLESELDEERRRRREVLDHDAHVLHALDRHALDGSDTTAQLQRLSVADRSVGTPLVGLPLKACSAAGTHMLGSVDIDEDLERLDRDALIAEGEAAPRGHSPPPGQLGTRPLLASPTVMGSAPRAPRARGRCATWPRFLRGCLRYRESLEHELPDAPVHDREFES